MGPTGFGKYACLNGFDECACLEFGKYACLNDLEPRATQLNPCDMPESPINLRAFSYVLAVPDLERSTAYFRDALGFRLEWPPGSGWQLVSRDTVRIMLGHCPDTLSPADTGDHSYFGYLHVDDADALHDEFVGRGAIILQPPMDRAHGMREFLVATPDGHRLMIGQDVRPALEG